MKIRVVSSKEEVLTLNPNERVVHLTFRPSNRDIFALVDTCPKVEVIQIPKSYRQTVSTSIEMFLGMQNIRLLEGDVWGHRKDIYEYYEIPSSVIEEIRGLKQEDVPAEEIELRIAKRNKVTSEMIAYILSKDAMA
ncbi:TPA: DUF1699 family protein [Methanosarcinaceae archaeon]|nr:DUF1699 family protein [Methanosarcinaceae archaeon]